MYFTKTSTFYKINLLQKEKNPESLSITYHLSQRLHIISITCNYIHRYMCIYTFIYIYIYIYIYKISCLYAGWPICNEIHFIPYCFNRPPTHALEVLMPIQPLKVLSPVTVSMVGGGFLKNRASWARGLVWNGSMQKRVSVPYPWTQQ